MVSRPTILVVYLYVTGKNNIINNKMKELNAFRKFLAEGQTNEVKDIKNVKAMISKARMERDKALKDGNDGLADKIEGKLKTQLDNLDYDWKSDSDAMEVLGDFLEEEKNVSENTQSKDRMVKQIERALKDNISIFELPIATQDYYRKNKSDFLSEELIYIQDENVMDQLEDSQIDFELVGKYDPGKGQAVKVFDPADVDKIKNLSENALGVDKGDGTFEITSDIEIMGQKFNFSDICPSAHKLVQNQALVHQGFSRTAPTVLMFAILHRDFFALEKEALGPQGIDVDTFNNDVTRLYTEILNVAEKLGVRKQAKEYMDMHLAKIKDNGFKASEPGGSSDRNFEEQLKEVRSRIASEVEGYTDLHENDVALEAFLGESNAESNPLRGIKNMFQAIIPVKLDTDTLGDLGYAKATGLRGDLSAIEFFTENPDKYEKYTNLLNQASNFGVKVNPNTNILDAYNAIADAAEQYELRENLEEGPYGSKTGYQVNYKTMDNKVVSAGSEIFASEDEAKSFMEEKKTDPKTISIKIWEFYGPGSARDSGAQYMGGMKEIDSYTHPAYYKKSGELSPEEENIKNYLGSPSFTHKRYGITQDFELMDIINQQKADRKAYIVSLDESLEEAAKPDEKAIKALAAKLMKDPKYKAKYKGKKGVEFVKTAMEDAEKQLKGK